MEQATIHGDWEPVPPAPEDTFEVLVRISLVGHRSTTYTQRVDRPTIERILDVLNEAKGQ